MIIKKAVVCTVILLIIVAAAMYTDMNTRTRYQQENTSSLRTYQTQVIQDMSSWFSPREYVKIIRKSPETAPD